MNTIEKFIREHRNELDIFTPSAAVWGGIEPRINHPSLLKSSLSWLKYAGLSVPVIAALVYLKINSPAEAAMQASNENSKSTSVSSPGASSDEEKLSPAKSGAMLVASEEKKYKISLCKELSSAEYDYAPSLIDDSAHSIIFTSTRNFTANSNNLAHLCYSSFTNGQWNTPIPIDTNMSTGNNAVITIDKKRKVVFFTRCPIVKNQHSKCGLYYSFMNGEMVGDPIPVQFEKPGSGDYNFGHPFYSNELNVLIFSSDIPGGYGGLDIWFIKYDSNTDSWSKPVNAGASVNTPQDEAFPNLRPDGTLYFSSAGHIGFGMWDIFKAPKKEGLSWGNAENIGQPINSVGDDFGITFRNNESGYFSSNRSGGLGEDDIYEFSTQNENTSSQTGAFLPAQGASPADNTILLQLGVVLNKESCNESTELLKISDVKVLPNPNSGSFSVEFTSNIKADLTIRIFSSSGQVINIESVSVSKGTFHKQCDLQNPSAGICYVQVLRSCVPLYTERVIIKK